jgi:TetR/AcrR family transcriptional regulator, fatty acid metabolism regulator protein
MEGKKRKAEIIQAAIEAFAKKGFNATTISDISKEVGIAEATIYEYFKGKEEILLAIPEEAMREYMASLNRHLIAIKGADNKLRKLLWHIFDFYENNKMYMTIFISQLRVNPRFYGSPAYELIKQYSKLIDGIVEEGKREGIFRKDIDPKILRSMITGGMDHLVLPLIMMNRPYKIMDKLEAFHDIVISTLSAKDLKQTRTPNKN